MVQILPAVLQFRAVEENKNSARMVPQIGPLIRDSPTAITLAERGNISKEVKVEELTLSLAKVSLQPGIHSSSAHAWH
jgi:hypothetical protein